VGHSSWTLGAAGLSLAAELSRVTELAALGVSVFVGAVALAGCHPLLPFEIGDDCEGYEDEG